jgi:hypothetical protein
MLLTVYGMSTDKSRNPSPFIPTLQSIYGRREEEKSGEFRDCCHSQFRQSNVKYVRLSLRMHGVFLKLISLIYSMQFY